MKLLLEADLRTVLTLKRKSLKMTQEELAKKIGFGTMGLSHLESGDRKLKLEDLERWAKALGFILKIDLVPAIKS